MVWRKITNTNSHECRGGKLRTNSSGGQESKVMGWGENLLMHDHWPFLVGEEYDKPEAKVGMMTSLSSDSESWPDGTTRMRMRAGVEPARARRGDPSFEKWRTLTGEGERLLVVLVTLVVVVRTTETLPGSNPCKVTPSRWMTSSWDGFRTNLLSSRIWR